MDLVRDDQVGDAVTTKRFLLDLLEHEKSQAQSTYSLGKRSSEDYTIYLIRIIAVEKARQLVQNGPDEP